MRPIGLGHAHAGHEPRLRGCPPALPVEAHALLPLAADAAGKLTAVAEMNRDGAIGVTRHDPSGGLDAATVEIQLHDGHLEAAVLAAVRIFPVFHAQMP